MTLPSSSRRLDAPEPGWTIDTDVVVVGSGIAGLTTALHITRQSSLRVLLVTKDLIAAGSTRWAQGGIAAALGADDSPEQHFDDTIVAGAGLCDEAAVRILVREGPAAVRELAQIGARFDRARDGALSLTREGGHHRDRIAHAGGDATGAEIERALVARVLDAAGVEVIEHALVLDLQRAPSGAVAGLTLHVMGEGQRDGVGAVRARAVVLATGGIGQVYRPPRTRASRPATELRRRCGPVLSCATSSSCSSIRPSPGSGATSRGQQPLVSEAVRGEGAFLVDDSGARFMVGQHDLADLAPRDVVAKAIVRRMAATGSDHVWLDATAFGAEKWRVRFPTIHQTLLSLGIDPVHELIPVVPASHYASGGVRTDLHGESSVPGLFVCGESACTGVHGANRLASNSLLEGLVFGRRIADVIVHRLRRRRCRDAGARHRRGRRLRRTARRCFPPRRATLMSRFVGVLRDREGTGRSGPALGDLHAAHPATPATESWEATNLLTVAAALVAAARLREETRGTHWRDDFPDADDLHWHGHVDTVLTTDGSLRTTFTPDPA